MVIAVLLGCKRAIAPSFLTLIRISSYLSTAGVRNNGLGKFVALGMISNILVLEEELAKMFTSFTLP